MTRLNLRRKLNRLRRLGPSLWARKRLQQLLYDRFSHIPKLPALVMVELTNKCNARCIMCDHQKMTRKKGIMDFGLFQKIIDDADRLGIRQVQLNRLGEALLHPSLVEMIRYATDKKRLNYVYLISNASLLNDVISTEIIQSGLDSITFSLEGAGKETFEKIRVGLKYETVVGNIERFLEIRSRLNLTKPRVVMNSILMKDTREEMVEIVNRWGSRVDELNIISAIKYGSIEDYSIVNVSDSDVVRQPCFQLRERMALFWNGDVTVCCGDVDGVLAVGNIQDSTIEKLWRGEKIDKIRDVHFSRDFSSLPICEHCDATNKTKLKSMRKSGSKYR